MTRPVANFHRYSDNAVFHRHGRIISSVFSPRIRQIAADEFSVRNFVVNALTRVLGEFTAEIGEHFGRRERAKSIYVVTAVSGLSIRQKLLEGLVILLLDRKGTGDILSRSTGLAGVRHQRATLAGDQIDLLLRPPIAGIGALDFKGGVALIETGYRHAVEALARSGWHDRVVT